MEREEGLEAGRSVKRLQPHTKYSGADKSQVKGYGEERAEVRTKEKKVRRSQEYFQVKHMGFGISFQLSKGETQCSLVT